MSHEPLRSKLSPRRTSHLARLLLSAILTSALAANTVAAQDEAPWELRVCAQPDNYPASSRDRMGYENVIAEIVADELGARLTYEWTTFDQTAIERTLHAGTCDAAIGIGEGVGGVESTVPFLRAPYVFVTLAEDGIDIESLDDPQLETLSIGTYQDGLPGAALENRGIRENVEVFAAIPSPGGPDREAPILDALLNDEIDVGIVYGPPAAGHAGAEDGRFDITPVTPEVDAGATLIQLFRIWTIGVRPNDRALRDRLNDAMAARWEDIQEAIGSFGVHQLQVTRPSQGQPPEANEVRIGMVLPMRTRRHQPLEEVGENARFGVELARSQIARRADSSDVPFEALVASAPSRESAVRAAERLIATEGVVAIAGGFSRSRALDLSAVAAERNVVFLNIAAVDDDLRGPRCTRSTFHIAASSSMYADAALHWYASNGARSFFLVHESTESGDILLRHVQATLPDLDGAATLLGHVAVEPGQFVFTDAVDAVAQASPDVVLLQLEADDVDQFLAQASGRQLASQIAVLPDARSQTRPHYARLRDSWPEITASGLPALWETSVQTGETGELNESFMSRSGEPMESTAWTAYAAIQILFDAAVQGAAQDVSSLTAFLTSNDQEFSLGKTSAASFRPWNHQLRQPLYIVQIEEDATWGRRLTPRVDIARHVATMPSDDDDLSREDLDQFGIGEGMSQCAY